MKRVLLSALVVSLFAVTALCSTVLADEPQEVPEEMPPEILAETENSLVGEVRIIANAGEADLNTICACIMFGFGSVCGLLAGSEVVRKWML